MRAKILSMALLLSAAVASAAPVLTDPNLVVEKVTSLPPLLTCMTFIGNNDMLVNCKDTGEVRRVTNGSWVSTVLDLPVNNEGERGLLGIEVDPEFAVNHLVYIYYTAAPSDGAPPTVNRVSRFTWNGSALVNEDVLIEFPIISGTIHNGGILAFGPPSAAPADQKLFIIIGDRNRDGQTQNYATGGAPDYSGQVLRLNRDGSVPTGAERGPFYDVAGGNANLQCMYAYGIRNSFGMDFDPVSGRLWDTENGDLDNDEINIVDAAFNSGWETIMGKAPAPVPALVQFGGVGAYSDPEFVWEKTVAPTAIHFLRGNGLGATYEHDCFVGESNTGALYHFELNNARDKFVLTGDLEDEVVNYGESVDSVIFGTGFAGIVDLETGPDGYLYVLAYSTIYRIRPATSSADGWGLYQ